MKAIHALAVALAIGATVSCSVDAPARPQPHQEIRDMPTQPAASRPSPPQVAPVVHDGVRYEQDRHDDRAGDQPGGYLAAIDVHTGARLWRVKVYTVAAQPPGAPVQALYFRSMRLSPDGAALVIENEAGGVYRVDLTTHSSVQVSGPPETAPPSQPTKPKPTAE